uniref:Uncharacterized protein n=1 Tax=Knipowitschia caucasica TaxID=637954 RepID=A0AAV2MU17_KNICA
MTHSRPLGRPYSFQFGQHWARLHYTGQSELLPTRDYVGHTYFTCPSSYANKARHAQPKDYDKAGSATNAWAEPCTQSSTLPSGSSKPTRLPPEATAQPTLGPEGPSARPTKPHPDPSVRPKLLPGVKSGSSEPRGKLREQQSGTGVQTQVGVQSSTTSRTAAQPSTSSRSAAQPSTSSQTAAQPPTSSQTAAQPSAPSQTAVQPSTSSRIAAPSSTSSQNAAQPSTEPPLVTSDQPSPTASAEECALWPPLPPSDEDHRSSETSSSGSSGEPLSVSGSEEHSQSSCLPQTVTSAPYSETSLKKRSFVL